MTPMMPIGTSHTAERWREQRRRRRIMYGRWRGDLEERARLLVGGLRREAWGFLDQATNPLRQLAVQFATLYDDEPAVEHSEATDEQLAIFELALKDAGYWALMQRVQRDTVAIRDMFVRLDVGPDGELVPEQVYPDLVAEERYDVAGRRLIRFPYLRLRELDGAPAWCWDVLEVRGGVGTYRVVADEGGRPEGPDLSELFLRTPYDTPAPPGGLTGAMYPYLRTDGEPYVPVVRYRPAVLGTRSWDPWEWIEVVEGTLNVAVYWSLWGHVLRSASWPQRYLIGAIPRGGAPSGGSPGSVRHEVVTDPATVLLLAREEAYDGQPVAGQWAPAGDPEALARAVERYEARIGAGVGVTSSDLTRTSGDPRSGYALAVSREAQREQQRRLIPAFRQGDIVALEIIATLLNTSGALPVQLPERGWRPSYVALPLSVEERAALRDEVFALVDRGYLDEVDAIRRLSSAGLTRAEARAELGRIRSEGASARGELERSEGGIGGE